MSGAANHVWTCPPKEVVAAVDFGEASARAVAIAGLVASAFDARFLAIHAERFEPPPYFTIDQIERLEAARRDAEAAALDHVARFVAASTAYPAEPIVRNEPPVDAILHAGAAADLLVLGTHGRRGPSRWWLGSVAERVVRAATVPVLVTRASGDRAMEVFERLLLLGDNREPGPAVRECAESIAVTFGGRLSEGGQVAGCPLETMGGASLVVIATAADRPSWGITDAVARALGACERPVLFVPARESYWRSS